MAAPIPAARVAPVTSATLPESGRSIGFPAPCRLSPLPVRAVTSAVFRTAESLRMRKNRNRIRTSIPVEICLAGRVVEGTVRNASDGGMFVETRTIPAQGVPVSLRLSARGDSSPIELTGLVWWTTEGSPYRYKHRGFGCGLLEDDERYTSMLKRLG